MKLFKMFLPKIKEEINLKRREYMSIVKTQMK